MLRRGRLADVDALFRLDLQCFEEPFRFSRKTMAALVHSPASVTLVMEQDEEVQAFLIGQTEKRLARIYLATLDVNPRRRRAGLASQLVDGLEREAYGTGMEQIWLHVSERNEPALKFYTARSYGVIGREADYYAPGEHALVYAKRLPSR